MGKILALDLGDKWVGVAISDASGILARPYTTVVRGSLVKDLLKIIEQEKIIEVVVGHPLTMRGLESQQTKQTLALFELLKKKFQQVEWVLQDERLSSSFATTLSKSSIHEKTKQNEHARAAAIILDMYLVRKNSSDV
jgi:putative Holliday junction resolvase